MPIVISVHRVLSRCHMLPKCSPKKEWSLVTTLGGRWKLVFAPLTEEEMETPPRQETVPRGGVWIATQATCISSRLCQGRFKVSEGFSPPCPRDCSFIKQKCSLWVRKKLSPPEVLLELLPLGCCPEALPEAAGHTELPCSPYQDVPVIAYAWGAKWGLGPPAPPSV